MPLSLAALKMAFWILSGSSSVCSLAISSVMAFFSSAVNSTAVSLISSKSRVQFRGVLYALLQAVVDGLVFLQVTVALQLLGDVVV